MRSVGETLRAERLKRNLTLDQISRELKISTRFLDAIEAGEFNKLPGGVFTRSFVRQYARLLGLDEEELADQVQRVLAPPLEVPEHAGQPKAVEPEFHVPKMKQWENVGESSFHWSGSLSAAAMFVVVLLICSGVYTWIQRPHASETLQTSTKFAPPPAPAAQPVSPPVTPAVAPPAGPETAAVPPSRNPRAQAPPEPVAAAAPAATPPQPSTPLTKTTNADRNAIVHVEVTAGEAVWILVRVDGKYSFSGTLEANQTRTVETTGTVLVRLGNAGSVNITLNGKPIGPVGPPGQVRTVQFTSGGFQIVPAKPPAALEPL